MATSVLTADFDFSQPKSAIKQTQAQVDQLKNKAKGAQGGLDSAAKSAKGAGAATAFFGNAAKGAVPGVAALGTALKAALGPIAVLTSAAGALTSAFSTLAQQDFAEAKVRTLGVNSEELKSRLVDVSRELAGQASVVELTAAAYDVASAGFNNAASASQVLKASSLAATGGFSDLNTVADATTSVLNAYGLGAEEATRITDQFIQTQNDGKIVIGQYAANIAKVAPVASALGIGLDEVNAAVAQITGTGTGAEVTFTALKTAFAQLASGGVGEKLKEFGVNIDANTIAADGFIGTLEKIKNSGADTGAILKAFGTEAGPVLQPLLNDFDKLNKLLENQRNAQGAAAKAAFEAGDTINGSLKRLQTAFTNLFADGSELGLLLKSTFKVAAVTVETLTAAVKLALAPFRAIFAAVGEIGSAISQALGMEGVSVAFELEQGFQRFLGVLQTITHVAVGVGKAIGQVIGGAIGAVMKATEGLRTAIFEGIGGLIMTIPRLLGRMYDMLPDFAKNLIQRVLGGGKQLLMDAAALGAGVMTPVTAPQTDAANAIQQTNKPLAKPGGTTSTKKTPLQQQQEDYKKLLQQLERRRDLEKEVTSEARELKELEFAKLDIAARFPLLKQEEVEKLQNLLQETYNLKKADEERIEAAKRLKDEQDKQLAKVKEIADVIQNGITGAIMGAIDGSKSLGESLSGILKQLGGMFLSQGIGGFNIGGKGGSGLLGLFNFGGGRAAGGTVQGGRSYMVGERGPELFTPGRTGSIAPNSAISGDMNVVVNVDASGTEVQGNQGNADQLGRLIGQAVQAELIKQKRPGGLLTR